LYDADIEYEVQCELDGTGKKKKYRENDIVKRMRRWREVEKDREGGSTERQEIVISKRWNRIVKKEHVDRRRIPVRNGLLAR
jgi:hypothetical protein